VQDYQGGRSAGPQGRIEPRRAGPGGSHIAHMSVGLSKCTESWTRDRSVKVRETSRANRPIGCSDQHEKLEDHTMTIRLLMAGVVAGLIVSSPTFAQDKASQKFLKEAIEGNLAEVQMGQLAQKKGQSDGVRSFGQMLQKDHSDANQKATAAANQMGMSPPTDPNSKQKAMYDKMSKASGELLAREFAKHMVA